MPNRRTPLRRKNSHRSGNESRELGDLESIGPAMLRDFEITGVRNVAQLARAKPQALYEKLCRVTGQSHDICCLDVFSAAVAQARNPNLPEKQRQWWYWSRRRKNAEKSQVAGRRTRTDSVPVSNSLRDWLPRGYSLAGDLRETATPSFRFEICPDNR